MERTEDMGDRLVWLLLRLSAADSSSVVLSPRAVSAECRLSRSRDREGERLPLASETSEVGDMDAGEEGRVESLDTDTEDMDGGECGGRGMSYTTLRMFMRSAYVSCCIERTSGG